MSANLSAIDLKVLKFVTVNGIHFSEKEIAKKLRLNPSTVSYSLKKLKKNKVIRSSRLRVNYPLLGINHVAWVFFSIKYSDLDVDKIFKSFLSYPEVHIVSWVTGPQDLAIKVFGKNIHEISDFVLKLQKEFDELIEDTRILLSHKIFKAHNIILPEKQKQKKFSELDLKILNFKMQNPDASIDSTSKMLSIHRNTVSRRLSKLWSSGIILKETPLIDPSHYFDVGTSFKAITVFDVLSGKKEEIATELLSFDEVHEVMTLLSSFDVLAVIRTKDVESYLHFLKNIYIKSSHSNVIKRIVSHIVLQVQSHEPNYIEELMKRNYFKT